MSYQIAVDGPAGAGKSTIAKEVAKELGFVYIDTGAMYRALAYNCINNNIDKNDEESVVKACEKCDVKIQYIDSVQNIFLNGENVSSLIRTPEVGDMASAISVYRKVREKMVDLQRNLAQSTSVIMDGRDIGSVVLPNATVKIYLDAQVHVRAVRRYEELKAKGMDADLNEIEEQVKERDYRDMHRDNSPLVCVEDAKVIDSSYMSVSEVKNEIIRLFNEAK